MTGSKLQLQHCSLLLEVILLNYKAGKFTNGYTNTKLLEIPSWYLSLPPLKGMAVGWTRRIALGLWVQVKY